VAPRGETGVEQIGEPLHALLPVAGKVADEQYFHVTLSAE
jgi:hypothetical protein